MSGFLPSIDRFKAGLAESGTKLAAAQARLAVAAAAAAAAPEHEAEIEREIEDLIGETAILSRCRPLRNPPCPPPRPDLP